jgi:hypothetical protein
VADEEERPFFFIHVMKTAGTTLWAQAEATFGSAAMYPNQRSDNDFARVVEYLGVEGFVNLTARQRAGIRFYAGHVPFAVAGLAVPDAVRVALVREPVARTVSYLRQAQRTHAEHAGMSLEEIYEDPWYRPRFIDNHQTKMFSMTAAEATSGQQDPLFDHTDPTRREAAARADPDDPALAAAIMADMQAAGPWASTMFRVADRAPTELVEVDDDRLEAAVDNLAAVEALGISERVDDLLAVLVSRWGWAPARPHRLTASAPTAVAPSFARRIAEDNAADTVLYQEACRLVDRAAR